MCGVSGVPHDAGGPLPASGGVNVRGGGQAASHSPLCGLHHSLQSLLLCHRAAAVPHSDAGAQDALHHTSVEGDQDGAPHASTPQPPQEVEALVRLPDQAGGVGAPGEVVTQVYAQVPEAGDHFHRCPSDVQGERGVSAPPEVQDHLLGLLHVDAEVVFSAPTLQVLHLLPVARLIAVGDASDHCCVIRKLHNMTAGVFW